MVETIQVADRVEYIVRYQKLAGTDHTVIKSVQVQSDKYIPIPRVKEQIAVSDPLNGGEVNGEVEKVEHTGGPTGTAAAGTYNPLVVISVR